MPVLPIRNLGATGVITDIDAFNLPIGAFTTGINVRFSDDNIERAPIPRLAYEWGNGNTKKPAHVHTVRTSATEIDKIVVIYDDFNMETFENRGFDTANTFDSEGSSSSEVITSTTLANVDYFNRSDQNPVKRTSDGVFAEMSNFPSDLKCRSLRAYGDFLVALNTQEDDVSYSERVRWSDIAVANAEPSTWDEANLDASAGFNDIAPLKTPIVDGATLGTNFIIYSSDQVWQMEFVGGSFVFNFRKLFDDCGVINQNCVVEAKGRHYVFDRNDIYVHDGITRESICDGRVRDFIFTNINLAKTPKCFITHIEALEEIYFCYASTDEYTGFEDLPARTSTGSNGCNRAAVYNYKANTWSFVDLPNVRGSCIANLGTVSQYDESDLQYDTTGATYAALDSKFQEYPVFISEKETDIEITKTRLLGYDRLDASLLALPQVTELIKECCLERVGIDLDDVTSLPLATYKVLKRVTPQISSKAQDQTFLFSFGAANFLAETPSFNEPQTFNPMTQYKVDTRVSGRFFSYKMTTEDLKDFKFSGMDLDVFATGRR